MSENSALSLIGGLQFKDPRLYGLLKVVIEDLYRLDRQINPPTTQSFGASGTGEEVTGTVELFTATLYPNNLRLQWASIGTGASYEIRYSSGVGGTWNFANSILTTTTLSADIDPVSIPLVYGNHTFFIKATTFAGVESDEPATVIVNIPQIPETTISASVIDNFVYLRWTVPTSVFAISYYNLYKGGVAIGEISGTFDAIFEVASGVYEYKLEAVDIVGNVGSSATIFATVNQPRDYELQDIFTSTFTGTKTNVVVDGGMLICCVDTAETFQQHFDNNTWDHPQDQIDAGYPLHCQPTETSGSYVETIDYGVTLNSIIATITWVKNIISGGVTILCETAYSTDNITYTSYVAGESTYIDSMRYLRIRFTYTPTNDTSVIEHASVEVRLDVRREVDSGFATLDSTDVGGTEIAFNKDFLDIDSITLTPLSTTQITVTYDFTDTPNPTSFFAFAWNLAGTRVDIDVSWIARGII